jgi:predicted enzyme related to lactoylglutathione lyase
MTDICPIGWFEIFVTDVEKAKDFYSELFGWDFKLMEGADFEYWTIFTGEDSIGGGFMKKSSQENNSQSVVIYVEVNDIEEALSSTEKMGGKIEKIKTLISPTSGYYALIRDLDNNVIGVWSET